VTGGMSCRRAWCRSCRPCWGRSCGAAAAGRLAAAWWTGAAACPERGATLPRIPARLISSSRAAPRCDAAGALSAGLCAGAPARHGRAALGRDGASTRPIQKAGGGAHGRLPRLPIVRFAAAASRPARTSLRDGFASLDPAPIRKDLTPARATRRSDAVSGQRLRPTCSLLTAPGG
jgi:hypothetical protein